MRIIPDYNLNDNKELFLALSGAFGSLLGTMGGHIFVWQITSAMIGGKLLGILFIPMILGGIFGGCIIGALIGIILAAAILKLIDLFSFLIGKTKINERNAEKSNELIASCNSRTNTQNSSVLPQKILRSAVTLKDNETTDENKNIAPTNQCIDSKKN